jgi:hypothetical protein
VSRSKVTPIAVTCMIWKDMAYYTYIEYNDKKDPRLIIAFLKTWFFKLN